MLMSRPEQKVSSLLAEKAYIFHTSQKDVHCCKKYFSLAAEKQQDASLDALIGELDTSYIDLPELIPHDGEEEQANVVQKD